jgi:hypothetical protein
MTPNVTLYISGDIQRELRDWRRIVSCWIRGARGLGEDKRRPRRTVHSAVTWMKIRRIRKGFRGLCMWQRWAFWIELPTSMARRCRGDFG